MRTKKQTRRALLVEKVRLLGCVRKAFLPGMSYLPEGICWQIIKQRENDFIPLTAANEVLDYIMKSLGSSVYLDEWIQTNRPEYPTDAASIEAARLAWIDWMIVCYKEDLQKPENK